MEDKIVISITFHSNLIKSPVSFSSKISIITAKRSPPPPPSPPPPDTGKLPPSLSLSLVMASTSTKLAKSLTRYLSSRRSTTRLLSTFSSSSPSITQPPPIPTVRSYPSSSQTLYHFLHFSPNSLASRLNPSRLRVTRSGPIGTGSDRPPTEMAPLFPGCDYKHWLIIVDKPGGEGATKQQMIDCYIQTLAKVLGSEEEAKKKIYNVSCERYFGFGCEIDEETANKMENFPGVLFVLPDSYVDAEYQDYGAELLVNGEIVQRPPERQRRVEPVPQRERPRPNSPRPRRRY